MKNIGTNLNNSFYRLLKKHATNQYELKPFANEWLYIIGIALAAKFATMLFGAYAGFEYIYELVFSALSNKAASVFFSLLILVGIELLTALVLVKLAKFVLHKITKTAIALTVAACLIWFTSFQINTKGLASRQSAKADITSTIQTETDLKLSECDSRYGELIDGIESAIQTVQSNPKGRNGSISQNQLQMIANYGTQKISLIEKREAEKTNIQKQHETRLSQNDAKMNDVAKKYWLVMAINMVVQLLANGFLMFSWANIRNENDPEAETRDKMDQIVFDINSFVETVFETVLQRKKNTVFASIEKLGNGTQNALPTSTHDNRGGTETVGNGPIVTRETLQNETVNNDMETVIETENENDFETVPDFEYAKGQPVFIVTDTRNTRYCANELCRKELVNKSRKAKYCCDRCRMADHKFKLKNQ